MREPSRQELDEAAAYAAHSPFVLGEGVGPTVASDPASFFSAFPNYTQHRLELPQGAARRELLVFYKTGTDPDGVVGRARIEVSARCTDSTCSDVVKRSPVKYSLLDLRSLEFWFSRSALGGWLLTSPETPPLLNDGDSSTLRLEVGVTPNALETVRQMLDDANVPSDLYVLNIRSTW